MRALTITASRKVVFRIGPLGLAVLLSACQVVAPPSTPPRRLIGDQQAVSVAGVAATPSAPTTQASTFTIKRDTLSESISLTGKVIPGRSAQLTFHGSGTVGAVNVASGQTVHQGDVLADFTLDDDSLQAARAQATLADLAYQTEQSKLDDLQSGANKDSIQQMRVTVEKDQADIQKLQQDQQGVQGANDRSDQALTTAKAAADRKVSVAQVALQTAQDALTTAQQGVKNAQDDVQASQQKAVADQDQVSADAANAAATASAAVRAGQRQLDAANIALDQANGTPNTTRASQALETQQLKVDQDTDAVNDVKATLQTANEQTTSGTSVTTQMIAASIAAAQAGVKAVERQQAADQLELKHQQTNLGPTKAADAAAIKGAQYGVDATKEQLANLQLAEQAAQQKAQRLAKAAANAKAPAGAPADQRAVQAAQTGVKQAEANLQTAKLNLDDAQTAAAAAADAATTPALFADHALTAAQAQLSADQARLQTLQNATSGSEVAREQARVNVLKDQSTAAQAAAQPTVTLQSPFDGTVADVGVSSGQVLTSGVPTIDPASGEVRAPAIRLVAAGMNSILANATESDVAQLDRGQKLDVSFAGLPGQSTTGTVVDIASSASVDKNSQVSYPIRIDLPDPPPSLKLGMTAQASLSVPQATDVLVAPRRAIRTVGGQTLLDKIGPDGQVQAVPVQVGRTSGANVELLSGVQEGDTVAIYDAAVTTASAPNQP
jgi:multidrug efflux pump subunit AcrA (membrane-fusion protein)